MTDEDLPPRGDPERATVLLINDHYRKLGAFAWDLRRFRRLAVAGGWTERELAARVGLDAAQFKDRAERNRFNRPEGILLTQLERLIRFMLTGYDDGHDLFNHATRPANSGAIRTDSKAT